MLAKTGERWKKADVILRLMMIADYPQFVAFYDWWIRRSLLFQPRPNRHNLVHNLVKDKHWIAQLHSPFVEMPAPSVEHIHSQH